MANLAITGRHALLFDDDSGAHFVNSPAALVPWGADPSLLIDRHDVRHLLDRVPPRPKPGFVYRSEDEVAEELVADRERFLDLPSEDASVPDETEETNHTQGAYAAVSFSYGTTGEDAKSGSELKPEGFESCYRPPFPLPDMLLNNLPPSEKVHQIIARTAKFVSEHGGQSEIVLRVKQGNNPTFGFLMPDHHLHPYFRFLVDNPNVLNTHASSDKGALSLLGSVYDSGEDEDAVTASPSNTHPIPKGMESERNVTKQEEKETPILTEERPALAKKNPSIAKINPIIAKAKVKEGTDNVGPSKPQVVMMEPSSVMKIAMEKIAEFIRRNGRELEAVLINQDRSSNNFPFLVPTNAYHPYYLKILEEAKERKDSTEKRGREPTPPSQAVSREPSEEPVIPEKFKMSIGKTKKTERTESTNQNPKAGLSTQEAAAIVNAAIRGVSPSFHPEPPKADSVQSGAARTKSNGIDEDWIAKTIAKTAALVSSEAASVSKEEKIKAERLKKAKMFASMIKSSGDSSGAPPLPLLLNKVESSKVEDDKGLGSKNEVSGGDSSLREKLEKGRSEREKRHHEKNYRKPDNLPESETSERKREKYSDEETCDKSPGHDKKRRKHRHGGERHKRYHSSSDEERERTERKRRGHSPDDREGHVSKRERRRYRKNYSSSDSEEEGRHDRRSHRDERRRSSSRRSDSEEESRHHRRSHRDERRKSSSRRSDSEEESRHHRRSHKDERRKSSSRRSDSEEESRRHRRSRRDERRRSSRRSDSEEESGYHRCSHRDEPKRSSSRRSEDEREASVSDAGKKREDSADVPDELRAKIRAMLMETL